MRVAALLAIALATVAPIAATAATTATITTVVMAADKIDARRLSLEERLQHACKAASFLRKHLQDKKDVDRADNIATEWLVEVSCVPPKRK